MPPISGASRTLLSHEEELAARLRAALWRVPRGKKSGSENLKPATAQWARKQPLPEFSLGREVGSRRQPFRGEAVREPWSLRAGRSRAQDSGVSLRLAWGLNNTL